MLREKSWPTTFEYDRLLELVRTLAYRELDAPIQLSSGALSSFYIDCRRVTLHPEGLSLTARAVLRHIQREFSPQFRNLAIAGVESGGITTAGAISLLAHFSGLHLPALIVRKESKEHGLKRLVEGKDNLQGDQHQCVLFEDVITTGASVVKAWEKLKESGIEVVGIVALVDREEGGSATIEIQTGLVPASILTRSELSKRAT